MSYEHLYNYKDEKIEKEKIRHPDMELSELQNMTQKKAVRLFRKGVKSENINRTQLLMSIIMAASRVQWSKTDMRGIREFWYNPVKPIVYRVYGRKIDDLDESQVSSICDNMGHILSVMVQSNLVKYEDLGIEDFRTKRILWETREGANCWSKIVLFVEKDSAWIHLRPLQKLLNITLLSGGGVSKTALNEYLMKRLPKGKYTLFTFTDYDPWGFFISGECFAKLRRMGWDLEVIRIGLNPDQVSKEVTQHQKYPVKMDHKGVIWAPEYGILGGLRTVNRKRKVKVKDLETGRIKKVEETYEAYRGKKGWGLEIEAISGEAHGAQHLREIVFKAMLKHLKEEDRLDEIKTPLWEKIGWDTNTNPFTTEEWENYLTYGLSDIDKIITEELYDELKEGRETVWDEERTPIVDQTRRVEEEDESLMILNHDLSYSVLAFTRAAKELATRCLDEQIEELERKKRIINQKIETTGFLEEKNMARWLNFLRGNLRLLKVKYDLDLEAIDDPYHEDIDELNEQRAKSDSIYVTAHVEWFDEEKDHLFIAKTNEEEELSFGVMPGVHMEILKKGGDISDLFSQVHQFDTDRIYNHIWDVSLNAEAENIIDRLGVLVEFYSDDERVTAFDEKWGQYLES